MIAFYRRRPHLWTLIDALRDLFDRRSDRLRRVDIALHSVHSYDIYR